MKRRLILGLSKLSPQPIGEDCLIDKFQQAGAEGHVQLEPAIDGDLGKGIDFARNVGQQNALPFLGAFAPWRDTFLWRVCGERQRG